MDRSVYIRVSGFQDATERILIGHARGVGDEHKRRSGQHILAVNARLVRSAIIW